MAHNFLSKINHCVVLALMLCKRDLPREPFVAANGNDIAHTFTLYLTKKKKQTRHSLHVDHYLLMAY